MYIRVGQFIRCKGYSIIIICEKYKIVYLIVFLLAGQNNTGGSTKATNIKKEKEICLRIRRKLFLTEIKLWR